MSGSKQKQYGLIKPKKDKDKEKANFFQKKNVFEEDSDQDTSSDEDNKAKKGPTDYVRLINITLRCFIMLIIVLKTYICV